MSKKKVKVPKEVRALAKAVASAGMDVPKRPTKRRNQFGSEQDPNVGLATRIKPGQRLPGAGRPKLAPMRDALRRRLGMKLPAKYAKTLGIPKGSTWGDAVAWTALYDLIKEPSPEKFGKYANESDGPQPTEISGPQGSPIPVNFDMGPGVTVHEQLRTVTARLRDRLSKTITES